MEVRKSNGSYEEYDRKKLVSIVKKAYKSAKIDCTAGEAESLVDSLYIYDGILCSSIRVQIEERLAERNPLLRDAYKNAKSKKDEIAHFVEQNKNFIKRFTNSSNTANATIDDNSNVGNKNIAVLNTEIHKEGNIETSRSMVMDKLKELYPSFNAKNYVKDLSKHIIYKHDESSFAGAIAPYCVSITMYPFLTNGIKGIGGLSCNPHNLDSYCGIYPNMIFAESSQYAGAIATSEFLLDFTYFAKKDLGDDFYKTPNAFYTIGPKLRKLLNTSHYWTNDIDELKDHDFGTDELNAIRDELVHDITRPLTEEELKDWAANIKNNPEYSIKLGDGTRTIKSYIYQKWQQVIYTINQPAAARGFQSAFVNFSYFDRPFFEGMFGNFYFPDGTKPDWESLKWIQQEFMMWFNAERLRTMLTFPVETCTLLYKDDEFVDKEMFDFVCAEYERGHSFFTYISDTVDSLASCCRLKNKIQSKEFSFTNGNIGIQTGSKSVITCNLSRITQDWYNKCNDEEKTNIKKHGMADTDYASLKKHIVKILDRIYKYHTAYNELLWDMYDRDMLPVYKAGFIDLNKQYLTIGLNGLNQAAEFLGMKCNKNDAYKIFCQNIFGTFKEQNELHKVTEGKHKLIFNTEQVPAESLAVKNYNWDKEDGYWVPDDTNLYASYVFKPNDKKISLFDKIILMGRDYVGDYLDGGSAAHLNLEKHLSKERYKYILLFAAKHGCSYLTFNVPNCQCADCGYIAKQPFDVCPKCGSKHHYLYDRIIGYLTKLADWSKGRFDEYFTRVKTSEKELDEYFAA